MARAMTDHAAQRQKIVARNIANADTPGFKAKDLKSFADSYRGMGSPIGLRSTRPEHVAQSFWPGAAQVSTDLANVHPTAIPCRLKPKWSKRLICATNMIWRWGFTGPGWI